MKNPIMTELAYGIVENMLNMDNKKRIALQEEVKNDYPKSKMSYVVEELLFMVINNEIK